MSKKDERLQGIDLSRYSEVNRNLPPSVLIEHALANGEGCMVDSGALRVVTGKRTGRSPRDKFIVRDQHLEDQIWWGEVNQPFGVAAFKRLFCKVRAYLQNRPFYVCDAFAGADPSYRISVRVVTETAWHNLFARQLFVRPEPEELEKFEPDFTVLDVPHFHADPQEDDTNSEAFILLNLRRRLILIGGTHYAGEIKKSIFSVMNYLMPRYNVMPMHCSANIGNDGGTALFFGLSGTGKTTLSADPKRRLIGDDEHGWSEKGIFNFEGGCYAKCIHLSPEKEPQIWEAIRFGAVVENVVFDSETRKIQYDSSEITENTRAAYPVDYIPNAVIPGVGGHPRTILFLTADAFGVLPPIARLDSRQAMYHFVSGYTSKLAGTEAGVTEPEATFSACFGAPFLPLHPMRYAEMLGERIERHRAEVYLVNTGWTGGPFGEGTRIDLRYTRAMVGAALDGRLAKADFKPHPIFQVKVPASCPDVPSQVLDPKNTWKDTRRYHQKAEELAHRFAENLKRFDGIARKIAAAGPR